MDAIVVDIMSMLIGVVEWNGGCRYYKCLRKLNDRKWGPAGNNIIAMIWRDFTFKIEMIYFIII